MFRNSLLLAIASLCIPPLFAHDIAASIVGAHCEDELETCCVFMQYLDQTDNGATIQYLYDAEGRKLDVTHTPPALSPSGQTTTDYCDNVIYKEGVVDRILTDEGYITIAGNNIPTYHYFLRDHLGSVRVVLNGSGTVEETTHYYPYGTTFPQTSVQPYKFCGKELDRVHGLDWYDSQARMYDPVLNRWHTQDSKAEDYYSWSLYVYCAGNPVNYVDPDGNSVWTKIVKGVVKIGKQVIKHGAKALTEGVTYAQVVADITDDINTLTDSEASTGSKVWAGISLASEALPLSVNDVKDVGKIINRSKSYEKLHKKARIGQEAHRQIEKDLFDAGASIEIIVPLSSGKRIRKDAKLPNGDYIIIKPDTPSGHRRAKNREKLMEKEGYNTKTIYYDPLDPKYLPESPSYIGPK